MPITKPFPRPVPKEDFEECCEQEQSPLPFVEESAEMEELPANTKAAYYLRLKRVKKIIKKMFKGSNLQNFFRIKN